MLEMRDGFNYNKYLKTKKIVGIASAKSKEVTVIEKNQINIFSKIIYNIKNNAITKIKEILPNDTANLCISLLLGDKTELSDEIQNNFRKSNLSHMLAVSGAHISYILSGITIVSQKCKFHKRWSKVFLIAFLFFFMALIGFTPSVTRACIMTSLQLLAGIILKKSDTYQNLAISSFIILLINPYSIFDIGFQLSYGGSIGIVLFSEKIQQNNKNKIKQMCTVTIAANLIIIPIMMYHFNTISFTFIISNVLASPILGICLILSMIFIITILLCIPIAKLIAIILQPFLQLLLWIAQISSKLPFSQILVTTPKVYQIILYYLLLLILFFGNNKIFKYKKVNIIILILLIILPNFIKIFPNNKLIVNFIDVGQGDSMLIKTPSQKTILIDGGGSENSSFDVGEKTLLPYLLDKGIIKIDYMLITHFDSDHCQGLFTIIEKLKVNNIIIGKQGKLSQNYKHFQKLIIKKKIKVIIVQKGDFLKIDNKCSFSILFPEEDLISNNILNNNSIVAKFNYQLNNLQNFSLLITGDIEEIAEKKLIQQYQNTNKLQSIVLKVAHHRF